MNSNVQNVVNRLSKQSFAPRARQQRKKKSKKNSRNNSESRRMQNLIFVASLITFNGVFTAVQNVTKYLSLRDSRMVVMGQS